MESGSFSAEELWNLAVGVLKKRSAPLYRQFFSQMTAVKVEDDLLSLGVPDDFFRDVIMDNYADLLGSALDNICGRHYRFVLLPGFAAPQPVRQPEKSAPAPVVAPARPRRTAQTYTFDNFVCGENNRHACAMARAAAEAPGDCYNPLFIHGTNGVGKTHLLQAIANHISAAHPSLVIYNITCDMMLNEYYDLLTRRDNIAKFRAGFRDADVLLVDDIHRLEKKTALQEEFFNIFNLLYNQGRQIVLTSDRQPCELSGIAQRLSSRFEQGMTCQVAMPEYEQRLVILRMWRQKSMTNPPLPDHILEFLAENISSNVRRLKGCFLRLTAYAEMSGSDDISVAQAEDLLHAQLAEESLSRDIKPETIQQTVANHFGITIGDLVGKNRARHFADPRMIAMYLCRKLTRLSSTEIGEFFGRTHANILHAEKTVPAKCADDETLRRSLHQLERMLQKQ